MLRFGRIPGALVSLLILTSFVRAQDGTGGAPGTYLHMGVGARALGLGKAYTALANDATAVYWNPAGLATQNPYQLYFMHSALFLDTSLDFFAATASTKSYGSFGLGILALTSRGFEQRSSLNEEVGTFDANDMTFLLSWSHEAYSGVSIGINYKIVTQKLLSYSDTGHGLDIGAKARLFYGLDAGLVFSNILNPKIKLAQDSQTYPTQFRFGLARALLDDRLTISTEVTKIIDWGPAEMNAGIEYKALRNVAVRFGLENGRFTFGTGITLKQYGVDYSNASGNELGSSNKYSFSYAFGGFGVKAKSNPEIFSPAGEQNISRIKLGVRSRTDVSDWMLKVVDAEGRHVRTFSGEGAPPDEIVWDGRDDLGTLAEDGRFNYRFDVSTTDGKMMFAEGTLVTIDTKGPHGTFGIIDEK
ncbi:MAG: PorV/PorQ family protein [bacterium]